MNRCRHCAFLLMGVIGVALVLFLLLPFLHIVEILLVAMQILCLVWGVSEVDDRIHQHRYRQRLREIDLQRHRQQLPSRQGGIETERLQRR